MTFYICVWTTTIVPKQHFIQSISSFQVAYSNEYELTNFILINPSVPFGLDEQE